MTIAGGLAIVVAEESVLTGAAPWPVVTINIPKKGYINSLYTIVKLVSQIKDMETAVKVGTMYRIKE